MSVILLREIETISQIFLICTVEFQPFVKKIILKLKHIFISVFPHSKEAEKEALAFIKGVFECL
jgi:hypothetical protein